MIQIVFGEQIVSTGLSPRYQEAWGPVEALRELIQEILDAKVKYGCRVRISWVRGRVVIEDDGPGFDRSALALGNSGKRGDGSLIGQFGEGMKLALLVLARCGRKVTIETVGFSVVPFLARDPVLVCETLHLRILENIRTKGTRFEIEASREELALARRFFLDLDPDRPCPVSPRYPAVMLPGGRVYVNGVLAAEQPDLAFSYALAGEAAKELQNRDRSVVSANGLSRAISQVLSQAPTAVLEALFRTVGGDFRLEHGIEFSPDPRAAKKAAARVWGPRVAQQDAVPLVNTYLAEAGFRLIELPYNWRWHLHYAGIVPMAAEVVGSLRQKARLLRLRDLAEEERANLSFAVRVVSRWIGPPERIVVAERLQLGAVDCDGIYDHNTRRIMLARKVLQTRASALATLAHETLHKVSGADDCTREFENAWQSLATRLMLRLEGEPASLGGEA